MKLPESELTKQREVLFAQFPPGQAKVARELLDTFKSLRVIAQDEHCITISYDLRACNLRILLDYLERAGFHLDNSLMSILLRALAHYTEEIQSHNLEMPERLIKKEHEAYANAWEKHRHGDHDDTPLEWREYQ